MKLISMPYLKIFIGLIIFLFQYQLYAQISPDVIFKIKRVDHKWMELTIPNLPSGATLEHKGDGVFHIYGLPDAPTTYSFQLLAGGNLIHGVSLLDLALMSRHISGHIPLTEPYHLLAADVNCDGKINVLDMIHLKKVILEKVNSFDCQTNYKFDPPSLEFDWTGTTVQAGEFISIKMGDVNYNQAANNSFSSESDNH